MLIIQLTDQELTEVKNILKAHIPESEVWAFGSRVSGKAKKFSDLDLVIFTKNRMDIKKLFALMNDFAESSLPFKVDIVDWSEIDQNFREIINKYHVVIQNSTRNK
jgi:predicted nucleotidyltransferase